MKLLLAQDISNLGHVGDVVEVKAGYARNYLLPQGLAVEPTSANLKALEEAKQQAATERARRRQSLEAEAARMQNVEVTIAAAANEEGHLYGSVGAREIAAALIAEGHAANADQIMLADPIRQLDTVTVPVQFADDLRAEVKVWVVREKQESESDEGADGAAVEDTTTGDE